MADILAVRSNAARRNPSASLLLFEVNKNRGTKYPVSVDENRNVEYRLVKKNHKCMERSFAIAGRVYSLNQGSSSGIQT